MAERALSELDGKRILARCLPGHLAADLPAPILAPYPPRALRVALPTPTPAAPAPTLTRGVDMEALAAAHRLVLNRIGEPVLITTGRKLAESGMPDDQGSVVVMLDGEQAFAKIPPEQLDIYWGAYLGAEEEILASGPLSEVAGEIVERRAEARAAHGWIMDTYLLRRKG